MKMFKIKNIKILSIICGCFLLCGLSFVFAFSSASTVSETTLSTTPSFSLYCVSPLKSQLESEANSLAKDVMKKGGAGYVWKKENYFYVISSAYENKNDALLVSADLKKDNIQSEVFEIKFDSINLSSPINTPEAKSTFNASLNLFLSTYKELFDISVSLDTKIYDETKAFLEINRVQAKADEVMKNFNVVFADNPQSFLSTLNDAIIDLNKTVSLLSENENSTEKESLISKIRYSYCEICAIYYDFLENIE